MSVEFKKNGNGKCPVMHGGVTKSGESNTARLWPNSINLDIFINMTRKLILFQDLTIKKK